jgi:hypothetical protein
MASFLEFDDLAAGDAVHVVVVGAADHGLVDALSLVEVVAVDEAGLADEGEGAVDGGLGDGGLVAAEELDEVVGGDVSLDAEEFLDDALPGSRELEPLGPHVLLDRLQLLDIFETESQSQIYYAAVIVNGNGIKRPAGIGGGLLSLVRGRCWSFTSGSFFGSKSLQ